MRKFQNFVNIGKITMVHVIELQNSSLYDPKQLIKQHSCGDNLVFGSSMRQIETEWLSYSTMVESYSHPRAINQTLHVTYFDATMSIWWSAQNDQQTKFPAGGYATD